MNVSHSKLSLFKSCRKKYEFKYIHKLQPIYDSPEATVGIAVHKAFDMLYKGESQSAIIDYIIDLFNVAINKAEPSKQEDLLIAKYTALGMYLNNPWINEKHNVHQSESRFDVRIGNLRNVRLVGYIDRISRINSQVKAGNVFALREMKTTGLTQRQFLNRIRKNAQPTAYMYGANKKGFDIECCIYDVIMRPRLRKRANESAEDFGRRITDDYAEPNKQSFYYQQHRTYRSDADLKMFEIDTAKTVYDLRNAIKDNRWYRNQEECFNYNKECPYYKICHTSSPDPLMVQLFFKKGGDNGRKEKDGSTKGSAEVVNN